MYSLKTKKKLRPKKSQKMRKNGINLQVHYIPVISHPYFREKNYKSSNFPNSYNYYNSALSIPLFYGLTDKQQLYVIDQVKRLIG